VYIRKRVSRRRYYLRKLKKHGISIFLLAGIGTLLFACILIKLTEEPDGALQSNAPITAGIPKPQKQLRSANYTRTIYPYSVIPGGIRSQAGLVASIKDDPVVAKHYARFGVSQSKFIKSEKTQFVHVAYRLRNRVYWTAKTLKIPAGETLISDGSNLARTRCGNRVSVLPREPVAEDEPPIETFDVPMIASVEPLQLEYSEERELTLNPNEPLIPFVLERPQLKYSEEKESASNPTEPLVPFVLERPQWEYAARKEWPSNQIVPVQPSDTKYVPHELRPPVVVIPPPREGAKVPEPGMMSLLAIGLAAVLAVRIAMKI
jgi:hypothetical protein